MNFSDFDLLPQSLKALDEQDIKTPTPIQEKTIPLLLESKDVIGQASTGSGKTLAFSLPMMEFVEPKKSWVQALVLTPTRELANQIVEVVARLGQRDGVKVLPIYGGRAIGPQITAIKKGAHILVSTPGRLVDLLRQGAVKLDRVVYAVVDEADEMLDQGFAKDVEFVLKALKGEHVTALFSATMPGWVKQASEKYLYNPVTVTIATKPEEEPKIDHIALNIHQNDRMAALRSLLDRTEANGSSIVFGRTKYGVRNLAKKLATYGYSVGCLQGNMSQNARDRVMQDFREHNIGILVATNVAARGLDVDHVELVVNYELPESPELLTHRVGRTGRMGREGAAYTLISDSDDEQWRKLKRGLKLPIRAQEWVQERSPSGAPRPVTPTESFERPARGGSSDNRGSSNRGQERSPSSAPRNGNSDSRSPVGRGQGRSSSSSSRGTSAPRGGSSSSAPRGSSSSSAPRGSSSGGRGASEGRSSGRR